MYQYLRGGLTGVLEYLEINPLWHFFCVFWICQNYYSFFKPDWEKTTSHHRYAPIMHENIFSWHLDTEFRRRISHQDFSHFVFFIVAFLGRCGGSWCQLSLPGVECINQEQLLALDWMEQFEDALHRKRQVTTLFASWVHCVIQLLRLWLFTVAGMYIGVVHVVELLRLSHSAMVDLT